MSSCYTRTCQDLNDIDRQIIGLHVTVKNTWTNKNENKFYEKKY